MLTFDLSDIERYARQIGGAIDQVPFALSLALNESAKATRQQLIDVTWPGHIQMRNRSFMRAALTTAFATKTSLRVTILDRFGRAHLGLHNKGGVKKARRLLAIPDAKIKGRRTGKGMPRALKPAALKNTFIKGRSIYQRQGKRGERIVRLYGLAPSAQIRADVPFSEDFETVMRREMQRAFGPAMMKAMRTRRR